MKYQIDPHLHLAMYKKLAPSPGGGDVSVLMYRGVCFEGPLCLPPRDAVILHKIIIIF